MNVNWIVAKALPLPRNRRPEPNKRVFTRLDVTSFFRYFWIEQKNSPVIKQNGRHVRFWKRRVFLPRRIRYVGPPGENFARTFVPRLSARRLGSSALFIPFPPTAPPPPPLRGTVRRRFSSIFLYTFFRTFYFLNASAITSEVMMDTSNK